MNEQEAYKMGYDYGREGANDRNCHYSIFSSEENTRAWEQGKRDAETEAPPDKRDA